MKEFEITVKVKENLDSVNEKLLRQGFKIIRKSRVEDKYMANIVDEITADQINETLKKCVLIRYLNANGVEYKKITYKKKFYDAGKTLSEEKINVNCDDLNNAERLFKALNFRNLVDVFYDVIVYERDGLELAFQNVENLGLLVEYEASGFSEEITNEEIENTKKKMYSEIKQFGLELDNDLDVRKAYELLKNKLG
ncbi:MAG: hypothetical protein J6C46_01365 [Clostridia bacterium]|nr:hypothetical protein [Clostridia bacterium]